MKIDGLTPKDYDHMMSPLPMGGKDADYWKFHKVTVLRKIDEFLRVTVGTIRMVFHRLLNLAFGTHKWETDKSLVRHLEKGIKSGDQLKDQETLKATAKIAYSLFLRIGKKSAKLNRLIESLPKGAVAHGQRAQEYKMPSLFENEFEPVMEVFKDRDYPPGSLLEAFERALELEPLPLTAPAQFRNIGNSCYMDASFQLLFSTTDYFKDLLQRPISEEDSDKAKKEVLRDLLLRLSEERTPTLARQFRAALAQSGFMWQLEWGLTRQQDADEFLDAFFDIADENSNIHRDWTTGESFGKDRHALLTTSVKTTIPNHGETVRWSQNPRKDPPCDILKLSLKSGGNLQDLIQAHTVEQHIGDGEDLKIEDSSFSDGEQSFPNWEERITFRNAPDYLVIELKRFETRYVRDPETGRWSGRTSKNQANVFLPERGKIDLAPFMEPDVKKDGESYEYALAGKVMHFGGTPHSGHYVAEIEGKDGNWYYCDDLKSKVKKIEKPGLEDAYILLLKRI